MADDKGASVLCLYALKFLKEKGIPCRCVCYGSEDDKSIGHVFHVNIRLPEAVRCNDDSAAFFREYV